MTVPATEIGPSEIADYARRARIHVLEAVSHAGGGHVGGPFSAVDMLATLYFRILRIDPERPDLETRDRFVLSKGHSSVGLYSVLALRGFFPTEELLTFDSIDSRLQGHPDMTVTPGIDMSSGSLGLGFSAALGIALGGRFKGMDFDTWVMLGDGECNEGIVWEGAHVASQYRLDNIVAIVDHNKLQQFGWMGSSTDERRSPYSEGQLVERWRAFGWYVLEVDGHDIPAFIEACEQARAHQGDPVVIVAHTQKGKGVSYMEGNPKWHSRVPTEEEFAIAMRELGAV